MNGIKQLFDTKCNNEQKVISVAVLIVLRGKQQILDFTISAYGIRTKTSHSRTLLVIA